MKKSKEELSKIANKAVETRKLKISAREMLYPFLEIISDGKEYHINDVELLLAKKLSLSEEQRQERLSSGQRRLIHRVGWVKWFLKKAELITTLEQAKFMINQTGINFLQNNPNFTFKEFSKIPAWVKEVKTKKSKNMKKVPNQTYNQNDLKNELLNNVKECTPIFFENMMTDLLEKMGYGIGRTTKQSHDGGIDGIVTADKLGLSEIYIQCKRYSGSVPISQIKEFIGTIQTTKTKMGVFITTGVLPASANEYVTKSGLNIQLVDGEKLTDIMYDNDIGLKVENKPIKFIDEAFFVQGTMT